jgi:hypothetical protein
MMFNIFAACSLKSYMWDMNINNYITEDSTCSPEKDLYVGTNLGRKINILSF